jgi:hypothetical protein
MKTKFFANLFAITLFTIAIPALGQESDFDEAFPKLDFKDKSAQNEWIGENFAGLAELGLAQAPVIVAGKTLEDAIAMEARELGVPDLSVEQQSAYRARQKVTEQLLEERRVRDRFGKKMFDGAYGLTAQGPFYGEMFAEQDQKVAALEARLAKMNHELSATDSILKVKGDAFLERFKAGKLTLPELSLVEKVKGDLRTGRFVAGGLTALTAADAITRFAVNFNGRDAQILPLARYGGVILSHELGLKVAPAPTTQPETATFNHEEKPAN